MKIIGIIVLLLGLLAIGCGLIGAVVSRVLPNEECELADRYRRESDDLSKRADATTDPGKKAELQTQALDKMQSARTWALGCAERQKWHNIGLIAGLAVAVVGFIMAVAGFFIFRTGRRRAAV